LCVIVVLCRHFWQFLNHIVTTDLLDEESPDMYNELNGETSAFPKTLTLEVGNED